MKMLHFDETMKQDKVAAFIDKKVATHSAEGYWIEKIEMWPVRLAASVKALNAKPDLYRVILLLKGK